ncbi:tripartite tricarboxylate transporter permease [Puniceibacterium confluentis]|uniref:tripartite tricarboxylate transporter permease n=1 Tax=Puniceibacterium confluentis TaxID=1958944 RepID=UPI0011B3B9A6|nr:tripartite tricarboxylate transporter permease [Puniceibacterium confluentis]
MSSMASGVLDVFQLMPLLAIFGGVVIGIIFGSIPGLTATMAIALCLPLTFGVDPVISLSLLVGLFVGGISGGLITAILLNIPGTPSSIATTFDGYPMTQRGEGGRALGLAVFYSFLGTVVGWLVLFFFTPPLARMALQFGTYEYFAISVFALTLVAGLSGGNMVKGLASATFGLLVAMIGLAPIDGYRRFTFGWNALDGGLGLLPVLLGLFALSEVLKHAAEARATLPTKVPAFRLTGFFGVTWLDFRSYMPNFLRSSAIGVGVGLLPGIGSGTSNFLAYMAARSASKAPERFGKGEPQGLIASESANNAGIGAAMVPLIALGIPGDATTALMLGGFLIHGIQPGPMLFTTNASLVYSISTALIVAAFVMLFVEYFGIRLFVRILAVPKHYLLASVTVMCVLGAFAANNRMFDVYTLIAFGALGYAMLRFDFPFAPLVLGFILGPMIERNLRSALMSTRGEFLPFLERPVTAAFLGLALLYVVWTIASAIFKHRRHLRVPPGETQS